MAILKAIRYWRPYLVGRRFKIVTNLHSLRCLLEQRVTTAELVGFDYEIVYRPGKDNSAANALSRRETSGYLSLMVLYLEGKRVAICHLCLCPHLLWEFGRKLPLQLKLMMSLVHCCNK